LASAISLLAAGGAGSLAQGAPLAERIKSYNAQTAVRREPVHLGAGMMMIDTLVSANVLPTNVQFFQEGTLPAKASIGQHFHTTTEEMFMILDGDAEFTVDGRTAVVKGPAAVPVRLGSSHAVYNPSNRPMLWLDVAVSAVKGISSAFDLNDTRVGVPLDKIPQFMNSRFDKTLLREVEGLNGGKGKVRYRRLFDPSVFATPWAYVDHVEIPNGATAGPNTLQDLTEIYYVFSGEGTVRVGGETAPLRRGQAIAIRLGEEKSFTGGAQPLEMVVIGVARDMDAKLALMRAARGSLTSSAGPK
jgi:mannose-6-phosphate isomerase-like protein (cupin superfamily)